jgi:hypothetical protein
LESVEQALPPFQLGLLDDHGLGGRGARRRLHVIVVDNHGINRDRFHGNASRWGTRWPARRSLKRGDASELGLTRWLGARFLMGAACGMLTGGTGRVPPPSRKAGETGPCMAGMSYPAYRSARSAYL